jgi:integrase/recombinase XerD
MNTPTELDPTHARALIVRTNSVRPDAARVPLDRNPASVYLASLALGSRRTMRDALNFIAAMLTDGEADALTLQWAALRFQHTAAIRSRLAEQYRAATANKMLSALRGVLKTCWRLGYMSADDYTRAADIESVHGETLVKGRALSSGEIDALMTACLNDDSAAGARDAAIIALLRVGGLRRAEICALNVDDYDAASGALVIRGKRNKERAAYVTNGAKEALDDWLAIRGGETGALFCPVSKGGTIVIRRMYPEAIFNMLQKRAAQAGVKNLSPHDFRRTFVSDLLDAGADIATVQKLAGHANVQTTARYDRRGEQAKRKAVELLHVPYRRRAAPSVETRSGIG